MYRLTTDPSLNINLRRCTPFFFFAFFFFKRIDLLILELAILNYMSNPPLSSTNHQYGKPYSDTYTATTRKFVMPFPVPPTHELQKYASLSLDTRDSISNQRKPSPNTRDSTFTTRSIQQNILLTSSARTIHVLEYQSYFTRNSCLNTVRFWVNLSLFFESKLLVTSAISLSKHCESR